MSKWQGYIDFAFANDVPLVDLMEKAYQMGRADEREKVIKQLLADLNPCVFCCDSTNCDKDYFFENCANEKYISWNELRLRAEKI